MHARTKPFEVSTAPSCLLQQRSAGFEIVHLTCTYIELHQSFGFQEASYYSYTKQALCFRPSSRFQPLPDTELSRSEIRRVCRIKRATREEHALATTASGEVSRR